MLLNQVFNQLHEALVNLHSQKSLKTLITSDEICLKELNNELLASSRSNLALESINGKLLN